MIASLIISFIVSIIGGIVAAFCVLFIVEPRRQPQLYFEIGEGPARFKEKDTDITVLRVHVYNRKMSGCLSKLYDRQPAFLCRAFITFLHFQEKTQVYDRVMIGRWAGTPEPLLPIFDTSGKPILDESGRPARTYHHQLAPDWIHIPPGSEMPSTLDIVSKAGNDEECYGYTNESYAYTLYRHEGWKLNRGKFIVKITVKTGDKNFTSCFLLINEEDFRLETYPPKP